MSFKHGDDFFSLVNNIQIIEDFNNSLITVVDDDHKKLVGIVKLMSRCLLDNAKLFDKYCGFNISNIGESLLRDMRSHTEKNISEESELYLLKMIFIKGYRFFREFELFQPGPPGGAIQKVIEYATSNIDYFGEAWRSQIIYANFSQPIDILREAIHDPKIGNMNAFSASVENIENIKTAWDKDFGEKSKILKSLTDQINNLTNQYNFVGLVHGFEKMLKDKYKERGFAFFWLCVLVIFLAIVPLGNVLLLNLMDDVTYKNKMLYMIPTFVTIELVLLYFFRILLTHFKSIKSQILQLDLRVNLCQFIQSYVEYSKDIKSKDPTSLEKFESIVFSSIMADESKIPSTFDGMEQVANLINSVKK